MNVGLVESNAAAFANIPGHRAWMFGVRLVGACLTIYANRPDDAEDDMDGNREQRMEDVHNIQDHFDEQDKHGEYGNDDIVIRQTTARISIR
jgi:hypothetical protein